MYIYIYKYIAMLDYQFGPTIRHRRTSETPHEATGTVLVVLLNVQKYHWLKLQKLTTLCQSGQSVSLRDNLPATLVLSPNLYR